MTITYCSLPTSTLYSSTFFTAGRSTIAFIHLA